jgi:formylmethanofuran dehydrogenase subunit E
MNAVAKSGDVYGQINTILKIAQKRAYLSATLMATALSNNFNSIETEDEPEAQPKQLLICAGCGKEIDQKVATFSSEKFGKLLCIPCQKAKNS